MNPNSLPAQVSDMIGKTFSSLRITGYAGRNKGAKKAHLVSCLCECGKTLNVIAGNVKNGNSKSCGCKGSRATIRERFTRHGHARLGRISREFDSWRGMKSRCLTASNPKYKNYGGRGISVCERWLGKDGFQNFLKDMGPKPSGLTLHRIDNNGNYCPENCMWADSLVQNSEKTTTHRVLLNQIEYPLFAAVKAVGVDYKQAHHFLKKNGKFHGITNL